MTERAFALPDLGEGLEEATVTRWLVAEGDEIALNQPIAEIETAKAVVEIPSPFAGRIVRLHADEGATVEVGAPLVTFDVEGGGAGAPDGGPRRGADPLVPPDAVGGAASPPSVVPGATATSASRSASTPAVRKLAKDLGVELSSVDGTGPAGRVTREDVERVAGGGTDVGTVDVVPITPVRRAIAKRLSEVAAIPQVTTFRTVDCSALETFRHELGSSPLPIVVRALADVVRDHRMLNASWRDDGIFVHRDVHVGIAIDTDRGLVVPVVRRVGERGIAEIADEIERLARVAREGGLAPDDVADATIAVSNTGSYGSEAGTPLLNPGHAVTIALGVIEPRALVVDGRVEARPACTLSVTFDHRVLDGATVGRALGALVQLVETDERLRTLPR
jgi:pyruvate dehydrogenase E2 component (dihydrolipoamide acetyltransferase)